MKDKKSEKFKESEVFQNMKNKEKILARILFKGETQKAAARMLGITPVTVRNIMKRPSFAKHMEELHKQADEAIVSKTVADDPVVAFLKTEALPSAHTLASLRDGSRNDHVRLHSALAILNRTGYERPAQKSEMTVVVNDNKINLIQRSISELKSRSAKRNM
jgi:predicted transcriptional regulator